MKKIFLMIGFIIFLYGCDTQYKDNVNISDEDIDGIVDANNRFAFDIYSEYKETGNIFISPYSIMSAIAMTYEGARAKTAEEIAKVLHLPDGDIRAGFLGINNKLNRKDKKYTLDIANALWAQENYPFEESFFQVVDTYYGGKVTNLDFRSTEKSRNTINKWVEDRTDGKIKDLISQGMIGSSTKLVLTNAIYFKADWKDRFDPENTAEAEFTLGSGQKITAEMMHKTADLGYIKTDRFKMLELDYVGDDISMLIILPSENDIGPVEDILDSIVSQREDLRITKVSVTLPKFRLETKYLMAKKLIEMGMISAFNPYADFTEMSKTGDLYIDQVIHQAFIEIAEYGTEAAAATAVVMLDSAALDIENTEAFNANHPFIFIIAQKDTGNILFLGRVSDPRG